MHHGIAYGENLIYSRVYTIISSALKASGVSSLCAEEAVCRISAVSPPGSSRAFQNLTWILHHTKWSIIHVFQERARRLEFLIISRLSAFTVITGDPFSFTEERFVPPHFISCARHWLRNGENFTKQNLSFRSSLAQFLWSLMAVRRHGPMWHPGFMLLNATGAWLH